MTKLNSTMYTYQMTLRPFSFCTVPEGYVSASNLQVRAGNYGTVTYERKLTQEELDCYGLRKVG
jgi:hypothetical protein